MFLGLVEPKGSFEDVWVRLEPHCLASEPPHPGHRARKAGRPGGGTAADQGRLTRGKVKEP